MTDLADGHKDLRSRHSLWDAAAGTGLSSQSLPATTDIAIIGAGITGAFLAERLTRRGFRVTVLDRRAPQLGSTSASTALLQWELDSPLLELTDRIGFEKASAVYSLCHRAVQHIGDLVQHHGIDCDFATRDTVYVTGNAMPPEHLKEELDIRLRAQLPSGWLHEDALRQHHGLLAECAIGSAQSAQADPVKLARGLLAAAQKQGAVCVWPITALGYECAPEGVTITTDNDENLSAKALVLATGYEMPDFVPSHRHNIVSSWALATAPLHPDLLWPSRALVWEAADPYLYFRTTADNRIIIGGEDEDETDPQKRDEKTAAKTTRIMDKARAYLPALANAQIDYRWSGFFGETTDSLPIIGRIPGYGNCYCAYGYGGNGITFSAVAAKIIDGQLTDSDTEWSGLFGFDRT
jgi:glycine/D-amino acid oxidase-like deaminating enzyme